MHLGHTMNNVFTLIRLNKIAGANQLKISRDRPIWLLGADINISAIHGAIVDTNNRYFQNF